LTVIQRVISTPSAGQAARSVPTISVTDKLPHHPIETAQAHHSVIESHRQMPANSVWGATAFIRLVAPIAAANIALLAINNMSLIFFFFDSAITLSASVVSADHRCNCQLQRANFLRATSHLYVRLRSGTLVKSRQPFGMVQQYRANAETCSHIKKSEKANHCES